MLGGGNMGCLKIKHEFHCSLISVLTENAIVAPFLIHRTVFQSIPDVILSMKCKIVKLLR